MDGQQFPATGRGTKRIPTEWRQNLLYEYYWEYNFPHTPTTFALRTQRYKFIQYHGIWDIDELYDLQNDPHEEHNLIFERGTPDPDQGRCEPICTRSWRMPMPIAVPFSHKRNMGSNLRLRSGSRPADFPPQLMREKDGKK